MNEDRGVILNKICTNYFNWTLLINVIVFFMYSLVSVVFVSLPLIFLGWNKWLRVISLFIGTVLVINNVLPTLLSLVQLQSIKKRKIRGSLTDEEFIDLLNYVLLKDCKISYRNNGLVLSRVLNSYFNNAPKLDSYLIIREYDILEVDLIIDYYLDNNFFMPVYREAVIDFATYVDLSAMLVDDSIDEFKFLERLEYEFESNVSE